MHSSAFDCYSATNEVKNLPYCLMCLQSVRLEGVPMRICSHILYSRNDVTISILLLVKLHKWEGEALIQKLCILYLNTLYSSSNKGKFLIFIMASTITATVASCLISFH